MARPASRGGIHDDRTDRARDGHAGHPEAGHRRPGAQVAARRSQARAGRSTRPSPSPIRNSRIPDPQGHAGPTGPNALQRKENRYGRRWTVRYGARNRGSSRRGAGQVGQADDRRLCRDRLRERSGFGHRASLWAVAAGCEAGHLGLARRHRRKGRAGEHGRADEPFGTSGFPAPSWSPRSAASCRPASTR